MERVWSALELDTTGELVGLTATVTATMTTSPYHRHTSATVHALASAQDLAVCYA